MKEKDKQELQDIVLKGLDFKLTEFDKMSNFIEAKKKEWQAETKIELINKLIEQGININNLLNN